MLGPFETSLRGGDSPSVDKRAIHKGCCGSLHGHGVKKERASRDVPAMSRSCSLTPYCENSGSSGDECSNYSTTRHSLSPVHHLRVNSPRGVPDLLTSLIQRRSQSTDYCGGGGNLLSPSQYHAGNKRSSSLTNNQVANRLYSSPTKSTTAKLRAERSASDSKRIAMSLEQGRRSKSNGAKASEDSGNFSSSSDQDDPRAAKVVDFVQAVTPTPEERRQSLIHGMSDDELANMEEIRRKQRQERRNYVHYKNNSPGRRNSPSPGPKIRTYNVDQRGRRSSDDSDSSSVSPPASPSPTNIRSASNRPWSNSAKTTTSVNLAARRTKSSGSTTPRLKPKNTYAFGSSTSRFEANPAKKLFQPPPLSKSSSDGVQNAQKAAQTALSRTMSDNRGTQRPVRSNKVNNDKMANVAAAWLKFKEDIEIAMEKKPTQGFYKNLSDMMHSKMALLEHQVRERSETHNFHGLNFIVSRHVNGFTCHVFSTCFVSCHFPKKNSHVNRVFFSITCFSHRVLCRAPKIL